MAQHIVIEDEVCGWRLGYREWAKRYLPVLARAWPDEQFETLAEHVRRFRHDYTAEKVGALLAVTWAERERLKLWHLAAIDPPVAKGGLRQWRNAAWMKAHRKRNGATPREKSLARTRPWEAEGISRSAWYRHRRTAAQET